MNTLAPLLSFAAAMIATRVVMAHIRRRAYARDFPPGWSTGIARLTTMPFPRGGDDG